MQNSYVVISSSNFLLPLGDGQECPSYNKKAPVLNEGFFKEVSQAGKESKKNVIFR